MFILALADWGGGHASRGDLTGSAFAHPGVVAPICHATGRAGSTPSKPAHHDCCDACALATAVVQTGTAGLNGPALVAHFVSHAEALAWAGIVTHPRTPRQSQGPPGRVT